DAGQAHSAGGGPGKLQSPASCRACIEHVRALMDVSERRACAALGQHRSTQRKVPRARNRSNAGLILGQPVCRSPNCARSVMFGAVEKIGAIARHALFRRYLFFITLPAGRKSATE